MKLQSGADKHCTGPVDAGILGLNQNTNKEWDMTKSNWLFATHLLIMTLICAGQAAGETAAAPEQSPKVWLTVGAKGTVGGNYLTEPEESTVRPAYSDPFEKGAGGIGGGGGFFGEVRVLKEHLGLELGFIIDANKTWCNIDYSVAGWSGDVDYVLKYSHLRIPLLFSVGTASKSSRLSVGIGPEFRIGLNASTDINSSDISVDAINAAKSNFSVQKRSEVALAWEMGLALKIQKIEITIDMRFTYNAGLPKTYSGRIDTADGTYNVTKPGHTFDGRILLGAGYVFTFGKK